MPARNAIRVFAPAKINLALHVTGQRDDGYHLIDSLVAFADVGDDIFIEPGNAVSLAVEGPEAAAVPVDRNNLILKIADLFDNLEGASIRLTKNLPVSSGIGGGSADAAAAFRGLSLFLQKEAASIDPDAFTRSPMATRLLSLGADIPMCLLSACAQVQGIGEVVRPIASLPTLPALLVNPRRAVSTPAVFKALTQRNNPGLPEKVADFTSSEGFISWLSRQRNDMEPAATRLEPVIAEVKSALEADGECLLARMSGSGATCFGLYPSDAAATRAARTLAALRPDWWVRPTRLGTQTQKALPQVT